MLGPDGLGVIKLGMTKEQAEATGLLHFGSFPASKECPWSANARRPSEIDGSRFLVSTKVGVALITAAAGMKTAEGIARKSSKADLLKAYPDWRLVNGWGRAKVPGNAKAIYLITLDAEGIVVDITLALASQDCYEL